MEPVAMDETLVSDSRDVSLVRDEVEKRRIGNDGNVGQIRVERKVTASLGVITLAKLSAAPRADGCSANQEDECLDTHVGRGLW